ncbi:MAG: O-antigen ligase family protein [Flavobacteriales bacterium]
MIKTGKNRFFFLLAIAALLCAAFYFLYKEDIEKVALILVGMLAVVASPFLLNYTSNILLAIVFLTPLSVDLVVGGGFKLYAPSEIFMLFVVGIVILKSIVGLKFDRSIITHPMSVIILVLLTTLVFSTVTSQNPIISIKRALSQMIFFVVFYFFVIQFLTQEKQMKKFYFLYTLGMVFPIFYAVKYHSQYGFVQPASVYAPLPFYDEHTIYGACLAFVIPFLFFLVFNKKSTYKIGLVLLLMVFLLALFLSYSRAAWISVVIAFLFYIFTKLKLKFRHFSLLILLISSVLYVNFNTIYGALKENSVKYGDNFSTHIVSVTNLQNDASNRERINRWVCAMRMFEEKPVLGFGPGTYQFNYGKYQTNEFTTRISTHMGDKGNAHSEYFTYLSETGIVGFLVFLVLIFYSIYLALKLLAAGLDKSTKLLVYASILGLITFYTHGLFNSFSDSQKLSILFISSVAILVRIDLNRVTQQKY